MGVNGAGKSTLIKMLSGEEPVTAGEYITRPQRRRPIISRRINTRRSTPNATILDDLAQVAPRSNNTELRSILGCFLFSEDDVFKRIGVLSGGERNRYALARMLMMPGNFLLLDEPTNHLDMRAKDVLLTALQEYTGTVVFVSHDRYFIDKLATRVIEVADGAVHVFPGNYEDYLWRKKAAASQLRRRLPRMKRQTEAHRPRPQSPRRRLETKPPDKGRQTAPPESHQAPPDERTAARHRRRDHPPRSGDRRFRTGALQLPKRGDEHRDRRACWNRAAQDMKNLLAEWEEVSKQSEANR